MKRRITIRATQRRLIASVNAVAVGPARVHSAFGESAYNIVKLLFSTPDSAEIGLYRSRLEAAGIECEMRNEHLSPAMPGAPFYPELWVLRDDQFDEAIGLMAAWRQSVSAPGLILERRQGYRACQNY